jgi:hypothetical protein
MQFPFDQFAPDAGETSPGVLMQATGVQPVSAGGYGPARDLATPASADALPDDPRGLISLRLASGANAVFGFTATDAYELEADFTWSAAIGTGFSCTAGDDWSTAQFGTKLLATNTTDGLLQYDIETPAGFSAIADAGNPREIFICSNTVVALDCLNKSGSRDNRLIRTSAIGNQTNWKKTGADYQQLEDGGALVGGFDLKNNSGLIFQDSAMRLIQFGSGGAGQFSLVKVADGRGSVGRKSCTGLDGVVYWLSTDGFKRFSLGGGIEHIGAGRIDQWFFDRVAQTDLSSVQAGLDPLNKLVAWRYKSLNCSSDTVFDDVIGYSWQYDRWFHWTVQTAYFSRIATPGYTLDSMGDFGPLDSITIPLDSRFWQGGQPVFAALSATLEFAAFTGTYLAATLETGVVNSPVTGLIGWATGIDDASGGTLELGVKDDLAEATTWKTGAAKVSAGRFPQRGRGMNVGFRRNIPAGDNWTYAKGVDHVKAATGGPK